MSNKDRKEIEIAKTVPDSEKKDPTLTEDEMSKVSGGISVNIGSLGVPIFDDDPGGN